MANFDIGEELLQHLETANLQRTSFSTFNNDLPFPNDEILSQAFMEAEEQYDNAEMARAIM